MAFSAQLAPWLTIIFAGAANESTSLYKSTDGRSFSRSLLPSHVCLCGHGHGTGAGKHVFFRQLIRGPSAVSVPYDGVVLVALMARGRLSTGGERKIPACVCVFAASRPDRSSVFYLKPPPLSSNFQSPRQAGLLPLVAYHSTGRWRIQIANCHVRVRKTFRPVLSPLPADSTSWRAESKSFDCDTTLVLPVYRRPWSHSMCHVFPLCVLSIVVQASRNNNQESADSAI